ncbi:MAG: hypothetical protein INQ03_05825 [Candidatus Heimdallarchaeota archaeon]|nr:hypothetical protein [Candidatus Heimdallarchaeota archaeon]
MSEFKHVQMGILSADKVTRDFVAKSYGKKGQSSDITLHTQQTQDVLMSTILPEGYPNKPLSLVITAHMSDVVLLGATAKGVDAALGESALLADCLALQGIKGILGENATGLTLFLDQMNKVFSKLNVASWHGMILSTNAEIAEARHKLLELVPKHRGNPDGFLAINTDHAFPVKGVGSVILGTVINGTVKKGQKIRVFPSGQVGTVRSIQVNDEDVNEAGPGVHVGLAMKGILEKYLQRGTVVTGTDKDDVKEINEINDMPIRKALFGKPPAEGDKIHVVAGLFSAPATVLHWGDSVTVKLEKSIPMHEKMRVTFVDLNKKPTILGSRKL